jgi:propane monooxygenase reductase subunit
MSRLHTVTVLPADATFDCTEDETILDAAIRRGFALPYGCRKGNCGTCKAQVLDGEVDLEIESTYTLSDFEQQQGFTLLCSAYAVSDATVEMEGLDASDLEEQLTAPADYVGEVVRVETLTHDIRALTVDLDGPLDFRAGQFAHLGVPGAEVVRCYSMSNPPSQPHRLEFMIKLIPDGQFSRCVSDMRGGEKLTINGPRGAFWIRDHDRPLLMVAGGAGMAPLWGMVQDLAERGDARPIRFFYGARTPADLFLLDDIAATATKLPDFQFLPVLSHTDLADTSGHPCGLVTEVVEQVMGAEISDHDAYLCGPPPMIDAALSVLERHGLQVHRSIFYDKFTAS